MRFCKKIGGYLLIEALISGMVFLLILFGALLFLQTMLTLSSEVRVVLQADALAQEGVEVVGIIKTSSGFTEFSSAYPVGKYHLKRLSAAPWYQLFPGESATGITIDGSFSSTGSFFRTIEMTEVIAARQWRVVSTVRTAESSTHKTFILTAP